MNFGSYAQYDENAAPADDYDGDTHENFMHYDRPEEQFFSAQHNASSAGAGGFGGGGGAAAGAADSARASAVKRIGSRQAVEYVAMEELQEKERVRYAQEVLRRRDKAIMPFDEDDERRKRRKRGGGEGGNGGGGGGDGGDGGGGFARSESEDDRRDPLGQGADESEQRELRIQHRAEMAAARVGDDVMYYSSCSDDSEVLGYELGMLGVRTGTFEEDEEAEREARERDARRTHVPEGARLFEETTQHADESASFSRRPAAASASNNERDRDDFSRHSRHAHHETPESRRARLSTLRKHLYDEKRRRGLVADECFKCMHGNERYDAVFARPMQQCFELMEREIGRCEFRAIAKKTHSFFKHALYLPMQRIGLKIPMWRTRKVHEHLLHHESEPRVKVLLHKRMVESQLRVLHNQTQGRDDETGRVAPSAANLNSYIKMHELWLKYVNSDPSKMVGYDDKANINLGDASRQNAGAGAGGSATSNTALQSRFVMKPVSSNRL